MSNGKGSKRRKSQVPYDQYAANWDNVFGIDIGAAAKNRPDIIQDEIDKDLIQKLREWKNSAGVQ